MTDVLSRDLVVPHGTARSKLEAIREAGQLLVDHGSVTAPYIDAMLEREGQIATYMGNFLAIPHGTNESKEAIVRSGMCLIRYDEPIDWNGNPVRVVVGIAGVGDEHLPILSRIALVFADTDQVARVLAATTTDELFAILESVNAE